MSLLRPKGFLGGCYLPVKRCEEGSRDANHLRVVTKESPQHTLYDPNQPLRSVGKRKHSGNCGPLQSRCIAVIYRTMQMILSVLIK